MKNITIGYRARFPDVFNKYLKPSIESLKGDFDVLLAQSSSAADCSDFTSNKYPAEQYNELIEKCQTPYIALVHEDITFSPDLISCLEATILEVPDFGAIGLVGVDSSNIYRWSDKKTIYEVDTLDSCFIMVKTDSNFRFNHTLFDEFHLYVEDYCGQVRQKGLGVFTIRLFDESFIDHCSSTWNKLGAGWGNHAKYREIFGRLYPNLKTT